ncbi:uncharacterized protein K452DRAFT_158929 [Aplosporella prunicola CBS 121167]|uniref:Uncharacterized protein n=1 Tax=Aplosporella prunicola CBS 121167 TaxID=1176127 RepID=A0A6A6AUT5_9PEZI|nr:uncharacterized protein K452DRAFT_158929 [Aplosporella prunicola CBS 121167]KAF2135792.1 hypothetical protein K452DRAFT_158929 [Aplosporella prunicola CBS 121167]
MDDGPRPPPSPPPPGSLHSDNVSAPRAPAKTPVYAPYTWRRYIHVLLPLAAYAYSVYITQSTWLLAVPGGFPFAVAITAGVTGLGFVVSVPLYPARNRPASFPELEIPWSRRSKLRAFAVNALHDFHWHGGLSLGSVLNFGVAWAVVGVLGIDDAAKYKSAKALWVARLKRIALYGAAWFGTNYYIHVPYVSALCNYLFSVQLRLIFVTFCDMMLAHLLYPPLGLLGRLRTLLYLLFSAAIGFTMLYTTPLLDPWYPNVTSSNLGLDIVPANSTCPVAAQALLYQHACFAQIELTDPFALHKQAACRNWYLMGRERAEVDAELVRNADAVAAFCSDTDTMLLTVSACIALKTYGERFEPFGRAFDLSPSGVGPDGAWRRVVDRDVLWWCMLRFEEETLEAMGWAPPPEVKNRLWSTFDGWR